MKSDPVAAEAETMTVVLTDIENSTWLWEHHQEDMATVIPDHHALMASVIEPSGALVKSTGDGVLATFRVAVDAVTAAVEVQRKVATRDWLGIGRLLVRVGIHTGSCVLTGNDVIGRPPNLAARLQTAGHGGQILVSGATAAACAARLPPGVSLRHLGRYSMRGFDDPVDVHDVVAEDLPSDWPPLRAAYRGFEDLPPDDRRLIGRADAVRGVAEAVDGHRLVTLWGPAGVGKTRLAVRVANTVRHAFEDGIRFVDLSSVGADRSVIDAFLAALRAQPAAGESPEQTLSRAVQALRILIVVDNCEHVLDDVRPLVEAVGRASPATHVLATSRQPMLIDDERAVVVTPLSVAALDDQHADISAIASVDAVQLFVERVAEGRPDFRLTPEIAGAVLRICRATDGLPYAIELAAARSAVDGLDIVDATLASSAPTRDRAPGLAGRLARSLEALDDDTRALCTVCSVFVGSFDRDLLFDVAGESASIDRQLAQLVRTAIIQYDIQADEYHLLAPVRAVVSESASPDDRLAASAAHATAMVSRAERFESMLRTEQQAMAVSALKDELAEHTAAFEHLLASGDVDRAARLMCALFQFGLFQPRPEVQRWASRLAELMPEWSRRAGAVLGAAALAAWYAGDTVSAVDLGRRAVEAAQRVGGSARWGRTALVNALGYAGRLDEAAPHYFALVAALARDPEPYWRVNGLGMEAISMALFGEHEGARRRASEALALARDTGNPESLHWGLYALGRALSTADPEAACAAFEQAMRWSTSVDSRFNVGIALVEWVALKRQLGDQPAAVGGALDLLALLVVSGQRSQLSQALRECGLLLADAGCDEEGAVALIARRGLPALPKGRAGADVEVDRYLVDLERRLGSSWGRVGVLAQALLEPELIEHIRRALLALQANAGRRSAA